MSCRVLRCAFLAACLVATAQAQTFTDVSDLLPERPISGFAGAAVVDVDGDGRTDVVYPGEPFLQRSDGFEGVPFPRVEENPAIGAVFGDVDGEGQREAFAFFAFEPDILRYQLAREQFRPIPGSGIDAMVFLVQGSILLDYDRDGALDALLGNDGGIDFLFRGRGDGTFDDVSDETLPQIERGDYGMMAADYDRDGDTDVYVGLCFGDTENVLYQNGGDAFGEAAGAAGVDDPRASWGVVWFDYDNDGWLDLYVANMPDAFGGDPSGQNTLFRNNGDGTFTDVAVAAGVAGPVSEASWTATAADFDNDGWLDLFVANDPEPSRLFRNNADGTFSDITEEAGLTELVGAILASGDVDGDGWIDLFMPGGRNDRETLLFNDGGTNGWLSVGLTGVTSNRDGIGARVEIVADDLSMVREITAGDGFMSQSHGLHAHFGLGTAASADVTIRWPSGQVDELTGIAADQEITVVEGVGVNAPPAMFDLTAPADGDIVPLGEPVTLQWEEAVDADAVTYTVHLAAPDDTDQTFETTETMIEVPASALSAEGLYHWAVVARDAYSARTSLDNASFTNDPNVASEPIPSVAALTVEVWPNPARETVSIRFELSASDAVTLEVYDLLGRRVQRQDLGARPASRHVEPLNVSGLQAGTYVVRLVGARGGSKAAVFTRVE